jgi:signal peptidase I
MSSLVAIVTILVGIPFLFFGPRTRRPLAAVLSWIAPGSGHIIIGRYWRGGTWTLLFVLWTLLLPTLFTLALVATFLVRVGAAVDALVISPPTSGLPSLRREVFPRALVFGMLALVWRLGHPISEYRLNDDGMRNTLINGDRFLLESHPVLKLKRGDVVSYFPAGSDRPVVLIGRIVALGGDFVETNNNNRFYINGKLLDEPYLQGASSTNQPTSCYGCSHLTVPRGAYFVVGDNRGNSASYVVKRDEIKGRVFLRIWSFDAPLDGLRLERLGRVL